MKESGYLMSFKRLNKNKNGASKSLSNGGDSQGEITTSNLIEAEIQEFVFAEEEESIQIASSSVR
ncbi:hypothetical protein KY290_033470 [Solanum tuberosum]|uniref:Uncharacterized protein n=1 Tax=Solanum tuberosum TaxID=4113 RepID=A0ABQ7U0E0_SOLTU|nr:hypothetical protein KY289_032826 [Solanum tuberosum]KAH0647469.1 hypothetical protein KY285_032717 [Solanum tuberosum]KAH0740427.1 hypothetical protein KY290_033470 [Solanum tuberosum]